MVIQSMRYGDRFVKNVIFLCRARVHQNSQQVARKLVQQFFLGIIPSFSTYVKFSEKLTYLTPWYAHASVRIKG